MPLVPKPTCINCKETNSPIWRRNNDGDVICNECYLKEIIPKDHNSDSGKGNNGNGAGGVGSQFVGTVRKSARLKPSKYRDRLVSKPLTTKGKSRRVIFKKNVIKAPTSVASIISADHIFFNEQYFQVGDVVSVVDVDDNEVYYAQIRGFLQDQYMNKSAVITWLLPTLASPHEGFDPATYILGPEEEFPRKMDYFEFVCHAPSEYFKAKESPYPVMNVKPDVGYVWTSLGPEIRPLPPQEELFGLKEPKTEDANREKAKEKRCLDREKKERPVVRERKDKDIKVKKEKDAKR